jgi:photosystem II stability/assembly factor-like uncharacterized protein
MITGIAYAEPSWTQVPLRTAEQRNAEMAGGEGFQVIRWISYAPSNPDILYLTSDTSQVWKSIESINGVHSWERKHKGFLAMGGLSLGVHPNDPNIVFVAGMSNNNTASCSMDNGPLVSKCADGIYRTTDGGESWVMVKQTPFYDLRGDAKIGDVTIGKARIGGNNFAFVGANTIYAGTHTEGLLKSTDGGNTWQALNLPDITGRKILDIKIHPQNSSIIFLSVNRDSLSEPVLYKLTNDVMLESIGSGLNSLGCNALETVPVVRAIAINPNNPDIIYVSLGYCGVYKSTDGGNTFIPKNSGFPAVDKSWSRPATYLAMSPASPANLDYLYVDFHEKGGVGNFYYTHDGEDNWYPPSSVQTPNLTTGGAGTFLHTPFAPHPTNANIAITSITWNHPGKTINGGDTWTYSGDGYTGAPAIIGTTSFSWDKNNSNRFALFLYDQGPFLTEDGGSTFRILDIPRYNGAKTTPVGALDPTLDSQVIVTAVGGWGESYTTGDEQVIAVTQNEGQTWTLMDGTNGTINTNDDKYKFIAFHPQNPNIVYAGKYKSFDKGQTWSALTKKVVAMFPGNGNIVYAAEMSGTILTISKSTDGGNYWTQPYDSVNVGTAGTGEIFIDPENQDRIYVAIGGYAQTNDYYGVYIWDTNQSPPQWTRKADADGLALDRFGRTNIRVITVDPTEPNVVYSGRLINIYGHSNGIFASQNKGDTWKNITYNLGPEFSTWAISVNPHNERVYIGSTHGIWYLEKASWYDGDNDGYPRATDCNDNDATVNPGMTEVPYNGKDDDCNPATKDDDLDGDGYPIATDCNDNDPSVNPGAIEISFNDKDDDCNTATSDTTPVDLYISSFTVPLSANAGQTIVVSDVTNNLGPGNAGPSTIKFYFSTNNSYGPEDTYLGSRSVPVLLAGASNTGDTSVTIPAGIPIPFTYYIFAITDADNVVPESDETNNKGSKPIKIN